MALFFLQIPSSHAVGECGLSCCLAGADSSGITLADRFGLSVKYEYMEMETIREGTSRVSPDQVLDRFHQPGNLDGRQSRQYRPDRVLYRAGHPVQDPGHRWQCRTQVPATAATWCPPCIEELPVVIDAYGDAMHAYRVRGLPTTIVLDRNGSIRGRAIGQIDWEDSGVIQRLESLL